MSVCVEMYRYWITIFSFILEKFNNWRWYNVLLVSLTDIFCALLAKDHIDNVCGLAINVGFYGILFTAVVFELVRRHDVRADCTVFPHGSHRFGLEKNKFLCFL